MVTIGAITQALGKYLAVTLVVHQQSHGLRTLGGRIQNQLVHQTGGYFVNCGFLNKV